MNTNKTIFVTLKPSCTEIIKYDQEYKIKNIYRRTKTIKPKGVVNYC